MLVGVMLKRQDWITHWYIFNVFNIIQILINLHFIILFTLIPCFREKIITSLDHHRLELFCCN